MPLRSGKTSGGIVVSGATSARHPLELQLRLLSLASTIGAEPRSNSQDGTHVVGVRHTQFPAPAFDINCQKLVSADVNPLNRSDPLGSVADTDLRCGVSAQLIARDCQVPVEIRQIRASKTVGHGQDCVAVARCRDVELPSTVVELFEQGELHTRPIRVPVSIQAWPTRGVRASPRWHAPTVGVGCEKPREVVACRCVGLPHPYIPYSVRSRITPFAPGRCDPPDHSDTDPKRSLELGVRAWVPMRGDPRSPPFSVNVVSTVSGNVFVQVRWLLAAHHRLAQIRLRRGYSPFLCRSGAGRLLTTTHHQNVVSEVSGLGKPLSGSASAGFIKCHTLLCYTLL